MTGVTVSGDPELRFKNPPIERGHWLLGILPEVQRDPLAFFMSLASRHGNITRFRFLAWERTLINHPDYIKHVLVDNNKNYSKNGFDYQLLRSFLGEGLLTSDGDFWLSQRRMIQPAFHKQKIQAYASLITGIAQEMLDGWKEIVRAQEPLDISQEMMRVTLTVVGKALFGQYLSQEAETVGPSFMIINEDISRRVRSLLSPPLSIPTSRNRRYRAAVRSLDQIVHRIISGRRIEIEKSGPESRDDLLAMLLLARDEETGKGMSDSQLRDEVMTLMLAGHETTANTLSWTAFLLSTHPEIEQRLSQELAQVLDDRVPTVEDLTNLTYTKMVIQESMRLYPPAWLITRFAENEDRVGGYPIPARTNVLMSPYITHRHPEFWVNPEEFDPERFTAEASAKRPVYAYFPFGGGPRLCIGRDFALLEAQLILAMVISRYRLRLAPGACVEPEALITLRPRYGMPVIVSER